MNLFFFIILTKQFLFKLRHLCWHVTITVVTKITKAGNTANDVDISDDTLLLFYFCIFFISLFLKYKTIEIWYVISREETFFFEQKSVIFNSQYYHFNYSYSNFRFLNISKQNFENLSKYVSVNVTVEMKKKNSTN